MKNNVPRPPLTRANRLFMEGKKKASIKIEVRVEIEGDFLVLKIPLDKLSEAKKKAL